MSFVRRFAIASVGLSLMASAAAAQDKGKDHMLDVKPIPHSGPAEVDERYLKSIDDEMKRLGINIGPLDQDLPRAPKIDRDGSLFPGSFKRHDGGVTLTSHGVIPYPAESMMVKILVSGSREDGMSAYDDGVLISDRMMEVIRGDVSQASVPNVSRSAVMTEPNGDGSDASSHQFRVEIIAPTRSVRSVGSFGNAVPSADHVSISEPFLSMADIPVEISEQSLRDGLASLEEKVAILEDLTGLEYSLRPGIIVSSHTVPDIQGLGRAYVVTSVTARYDAVPGVE